MKDKPIYTIDLETDPFSPGKMVHPFACGIYDGKTFHHFWGSDCIEKSRRFVVDLPSGLVYCHNLGGFDFFWLLSWFTGKTMIRNGRIVTTQVKAKDGHHEFRDSYAILPFPLAEYAVAGKQVKLDIDYNKLYENVRENHRQEILDYLRMDCVGLYDLVTRFIREFGDKITIGSASMEQFKHLHDFIPILEATEDDCSKVVDGLCR